MGQSHAETVSITHHTNENALIHPECVVVKGGLAIPVHKHFVYQGDAYLLNFLFLKP